jgi:hypothetical protein
VQVQINKHLADFVYDEDEEDTLLIIYYAGHGTPDSVTGRLLLAGYVTNYSTISNQAS